MNETTTNNQDIDISKWSDALNTAHAAIAPHIDAALSPQQPQQQQPQQQQPQQDTGISAWGDEAEPSLMSKWENEVMPVADRVGSYFLENGDASQEALNTSNTLRAGTARAIAGVVHLPVDVYQWINSEVTGQKPDAVHIPVLDDATTRGIVKSSTSDNMATILSFVEGYGAIGAMTKAARLGEALPKGFEFLKSDAASTMLKGAATDLAVTDPWDDNLADTAYMLAQNHGADTQSVYMKTLAELRDDKDGTAMGNRLKGMFTGMLVSGGTEAISHTISSVYKLAASEAAKGNRALAASYMKNKMQHLAFTVKKAKQAISEGKENAFYATSAEADNSTLKYDAKYIESKLGERPNLGAVYKENGTDSHVVVKAKTGKGRGGVRKNKSRYLVRNNRYGTDEVATITEKDPVATASKPAPVTHINNDGTTKTTTKVEAAPDEEYVTGISKRKKLPSHDTNVPLRATKETPLDADKRNVLDPHDFHTDDPLIQEIMKTEDQRGRKGIKQSINQLNSTIQSAPNKHVVYDKILNGVKSGRWMPEDVVRLQAGLDHALADHNRLLHTLGADAPETEQAADYVRQFTKQHILARQNYGRGLALIRWLPDFVNDKVKWAKIAQHMRDAGVPEDMISQQDPFIKKVMLYAEKMKERIGSNMEMSGYDKDEIDSYMKTHVKQMLEDSRAHLDELDAKADKAHKRWQLVKDIQSNAMLANPTTVATTIVSGVWQTYSRPLFKTIAGLATGNVRQARIGMLTAATVTRNLFATETFQRALKAIAEGKSTIAARSEDFGGESTPWWQMTYRTYGGIDEYFKDANIRAYAESIFRTNEREALKGMTTAEQDAAVARHMESIIEDGKCVNDTFSSYGQQTTFSEDALDDKWNSVQTFLKKHPALSVLCFPFTHTPFNMIRYAEKMTPLGWRTEAVQKVFREGTPEQIHEMYAAWGVFGALGAWSFHKMTTGEMTGAYPLDPKMRQEQMALGIPQYAWHIDGHWISFEKWDAAMPLKMMADMISAGQAGVTDGDGYIQTAGDVMMSGVKAIADMGMTQTLAQFLDAAGQSTWNGKTSSLVAGILSRPVPPVLVDAEQKAFGLGNIQEATDLSEKLARKYAPWTLADRLDWLTGKPVGFGKSVMAYKYANDKDLDAVHMKIYAVGGANFLSNTLANGVKLDGKQLSRLTKIRTSIKDSSGRTLYQQINDLTKSPLWSSMPTHVDGFKGANWQQQQLHKMYTAYNNQAEQQLLEEYPALEEKVQQALRYEQEINNPH